ncbi:MAG TPA: ABC transporter permease [Longimicrobiales bacterium]|nr:ABC transporter permease [Longimicrobiales bacterium]
MSISWLDVRLGVRMLVKHPALTLVGGLGLAVAVALSAGFFAFSRAWIYPVLPLDEGHRVVAVENRHLDLNDEDRAALHDFFVWREEVSTLTDLSAFRRVTRNVAAAGGPPEPVVMAEVTASAFRVARIAPLQGRTLVAEDEVPGAPAVIVIGEDVWQTRFAGASDVVGRELRVNDVPHTVVGVMPDGFAFPNNDRFWLPLRAQPASFERGTGPALFIFGRLADGVSMRQAQAELTAIGEHTAREHPATNGRLRPVVMPYIHSLTDVQGITLWEVAQMQFLMSLLLVVVAFNVGILVYARTAARQREIAVRSALGASRARIVAQLFAEALVLATLAAAAGLVLADFGIAMGNGILASEMNGGMPFWLDTGLNTTTVLFTMALAVMTAAIIGVLPGLYATRRGVQLHQVGSNGADLGRTWTALIVAQVAIAVAVLPAAVATGWIEIERGATRPAYEAAEYVDVSLGRDSEAATSQGSDFGAALTEVMARLEADPTVAAVTFRASGSGRPDMVRVEDVPPPATSPGGHRVRAMGVDANMLDVFAIDIVAGRGFLPGEAEGNSRAVLVNEAFAEQVLGGGDALGRRIRHVEPGAADDGASHQWYEVVGVARNMVVNRLNPAHVPPGLIYPVAPGDLTDATLAVRMQPGVTPAGMAVRIREHVAAVNPGLRMGTVRSLADFDSQQELATRLIALVTLLVLVTVLLLSAAGIYALMSFTVTRRQREIGIRSALGAQPRQVLAAVFRRAGAQVGAGLVAGVSAAVLLDTVSGGSLLHGRHGIIVPALAVAMATVALLAALGPARRGLAVQPTEALRSE